jgi:hypothetical protein
MNKNEWNVCDSKLKEMATGTEMNYCDKYCKKFRAANINNYCIMTNHKAVKRPDGRRYYLVYINIKYCNVHEYFGGYVMYYNYLLELDTDDFKSLESVEQLKTLAERRKWLHALDNDDIDEKILMMGTMVRMVLICQTSLLVYLPHILHCWQNTGTIRSGAADMIAFGRPYITNPDLVERFRNNWPLAADAIQSQQQQITDLCVYPNELQVAF